MRKSKLAAFLALGAVTIIGFGAYASAKNEKAKPLPGFAQLIPLVGEWEGTSGSGASVKLTYTLVSNGSALMERMQPSNEPEMITMYSADGDRIIVTHYCSAGNQPQMQSAAITGPTQKFDFTLVRVTGMKSPSEGHMVRLVLMMADKDHLTQEWTFLGNGKTQTDVFRYTRKS
jgi:Tfp pilus assembly protein PilW